MPSLERKIKFAHDHIIAPNGKPFDLSDRKWVIDQMWRPLDGWKLWPVNSDRLCDKCSLRANTIVDDYFESAKTRTKTHKKNCDGLKSEPILIAAVEVLRQQGKTFNAAAYNLACGFLDKHESIALLASSEDQVARIFNKNYRHPIKESEVLRDLCTVKGTSITFTDTGSDLEILPCAISSVGDTRTIIGVDECRKVPPDIMTALVGTLFGRGGWRCPDYHIKTHGDLEDPKHIKRCGVCGKETVPWYGKALLLSSAGELTDTENDWFFDFTDHYQDNPHPNVHVFASREIINPSVSTKMVNATSEILGAIDATKAFAGIEAEGKRLRRGDDVVSASDVKRVCDRKLRNEEGSDNPCVAFLDTSTTREKTSLVILASDPEADKPWAHVYMSHCKFWWPHKQKHKIIDPEEVEEYLETLLPLYPKLQQCDVDTKLGARTDTKTPWPVLMLRSIRAKKGEWRRKVKAWGGGEDESQAGWDLLEGRILNRTITLFDLKEIHDEFKGAKRVAPKTGNKKSKVVDRNRDRMHVDITQAIACACYRISLLKLRGMNSRSMADIVRRGEERRKARAAAGGRSGLAPLTHRFNPDRF